MKNYLLYSEDDFIMDPDFQSWVKNPTPESEVFWSQFLVQYPHKTPELQRAKTVLSSIVFKKNLLPSEKEAIWSGVTEAIQKQNEGKVVFMRNGRKGSFRKLGYALAAVVIGCMFFAGLYLFKQRETGRLVATQFGEIKRITLPDSSSVTLNARSTIRYGQEWNDRKEREVWIDGEAFFSVRQTGNNQRFIVHTNELDIEVLGTEFNVMRRENKLKISLNSGKIKLNLPENPNTLYMVPGDILEVSAKNIKKITGNVEDLSVWKENRLVFDDTPLAEIILQLKYIYGWEFTDVEQDILKEKLSGEIETKDEHKLINTLEKALRLKIHKKGNVIKISRI